MPQIAACGHGTRRVAAAQCTVHAAMIESQGVQIRAQWHGMVKMAGELKAAPGERDAALEKLDAFRREAEARREDMCMIASLRAWAELVVGGGA